MLIKIILCLIPILLGLGLLFRKRLECLSGFLIGYGILNLLSECFKLMIAGHPKPYIGLDWSMFIINNMSYLFIPCWLMYCLFKSTNLNKFLTFPLTAWACASAILVWSYPYYLAGTALIGVLRAFYISMLSISLVIGLILFFYRKVNLPTTILLLGAAEGILQYLIAIFAPGWWMSWIVLSVYFTLVLLLILLPQKYIDRIDNLSIESFDQ